MTTKSYISIESLRSMYERYKDNERAEIKPWSIKIRDKEGNVTAWYLVPIKDRTGTGLIPQSPDAKKKAQQSFRSKSAALPKTISLEHRAMLDDYVSRNNCTIREAVELAIDRLVNPGFVVYRPKEVAFGDVWIAVMPNHKKSNNDIKTSETFDTKEEAEQWLRDSYQDDD